MPAMSPRITANARRVTGADLRGVVTATCDGGPHTSCWPGGGSGLPSGLGAPAKREGDAGAPGSGGGALGNRSRQLLPMTGSVGAGDGAGAVAVVVCAGAGAAAVTRGSSAPQWLQ